MDYCPDGCPCNGFDCNMKLNSTDDFVGPESLGILQTGTEKCDTVTMLVSVGFVCFNFIDLQVI